MSALENVKWCLTKVPIKKVLTYNWTINNFSYAVKQLDDFSSSNFAVDSKEKNWSLQMFPSSGDDENYLELSLYCKVKNTFKGWCYLSVVNYKGGKFTEKEKEIDENFKEWHLPLFLRKDLLQNKASILLPNNCLTIRCEFIQALDVQTLSSENEEEIEQNEKQDMKDGVEPSGIAQLFLDEHLSDIKLITSDGNSLPAHRSILAAFSPVFKAMFINDMQEKSKGEVKISDYEHKVLKEMLRFIYTNKVENLTSNAAELISLADKYQIPNLKELCEKELSKTISIDNVLDILAIADQHNIEHLKNKAMNFIKANHLVIVDSDAFKSLTNIQLLKTITKAISQMNN